MDIIHVENAKQVHCLVTNLFSASKISEKKLLGTPCENIVFLCVLINIFVLSFLTSRYARILPTPSLPKILKVKNHDKAVSP